MAQLIGENNKFQLKNRCATALAGHRAAILFNSKLLIEKNERWMKDNARPYDLAKWNYVVHNEPKENILEELLKYQNDDGGFGHGFECDIIAPISAAIPSAEAIFQAYIYKS